MCKTGIEKIQDVSEYIKEHTNEMTKEEKNALFFDVAIGVFNDEIAGEVTLADGRTLNIPRI